MPKKLPSVTRKGSKRKGKKKPVRTSHKGGKTIGQ